MNQSENLILISICAFIIIFVISCFADAKELKKEAKKSKLKLFHNLRECELYVLNNRNNVGIQYTYYIYATDHSLYTFTTVKLSGIEPIMVINKFAK